MLPMDGTLGLLLWQYVAEMERRQFASKSTVFFFFESALSGFPWPFERSKARISWLEKGTVRTPTVVWGSKNTIRSDQWDPL